MVPSLASAQTVETADTLGEVVVTAHKAEAIVTPGMTTYTPSATLSGSGGSAFDAISSLPGVSTDSNGSLSVNGVRGIPVTINGRKGALKGSELTNYLKYPFRQPQWQTYGYAQHRRQRMMPRRARL